MVFAEVVTFQFEIWNLVYGMKTLLTWSVRFTEISKVLCCHWVSQLYEYNDLPICYGMEKAV